MKRILALLICLGTGAIPNTGLPSNIEVDTAAKVPNGASQAAKEKAELQEVQDLVNAASSANNNLQHANQIVKQILAANARSAYGDAAKAELYYRLHNYGYLISSENVQSVAEKAIALDPKLGDPHAVMARVYLDDGMGDDADAAYRLAPRKPESLFIEARISVATQQWSRAESFCKKDIAALAPNTARQANIYWWLSQMYLAESPPNVNAAKQAFKKSADLDPKNPDNAVNYADFLIQWTRDLDGVQQYAKKALEIDNSAEAHIDLAIAAYGKWAQNYLAHRGKYASNRAARDLKAIEARTGLSPEYVLYNESTTKDFGFITQALIDAGVVKNVDIIPPGDTNTAFVGAAYANNFKLAKLLRKHGANFNSADTDHKSTALILKRLGSGKIKGRWTGADLLVMAARNGDPDSLRQLVERGVPVNARDSNGETALIAAILTDSTDEVTYLLAHGADTTLAYQGQTPVNLARLSGNLAIIKALASSAKSNI